MRHRLLLYRTHTQHNNIIQNNSSKITFPLHSIHKSSVRVINFTLSLSAARRWRGRVPFTCIVHRHNKAYIRPPLTHPLLTLSFVRAYRGDCKCARAISIFFIVGCFSKRRAHFNELFSLSFFFVVYNIIKYSSIYNIYKIIYVIIYKEQK